MAMWKIWNCQTLHKSLEITNALIAIHVTSQTLYMVSAGRCDGMFAPTNPRK